MNSTFLTVNQNILLNNTYYKWLIYIMNLQYQLNQSKSKDFLQISDIRLLFHEKIRLLSFSQN